MGLFDELKKLSKDIMDNIPQEVKDGITNQIKEGNIGNSNTSNKTIPSAYSQFPVFNGNISDISEKNEPQYIRCTMDYYNNISGEEVNNYISTVLASGYIKATNVRYEKANTYIIVEYRGNSLHLVFHIKR